MLFVINDQVNSETGVRPLDAKFGSAAGPYLRLPADEPSGEHYECLGSRFGCRLKAHSQDFFGVPTAACVLSERRNTPVETQNVFQPGDLVFWERDRTKPRPTKLTAPNHGPWEGHSSGT